MEDKKVSLGNKLKVITMRSLEISDSFIDNRLGESCRVYTAQLKGIAIKEYNTIIQRIRVLNSRVSYKIALLCIINKILFKLESIKSSKEEESKVEVLYTDRLRVTYSRLILKLDEDGLNEVYGKAEKGVLAFENYLYHINEPISVKNSVSLEDICKAIINFAYAETYIYIKENNRFIQAKKGMYNTLYNICVQSLILVEQGVKLLKYDSIRVNLNWIIDELSGTSGDKFDEIVIRKFIEYIAYEIDINVVPMIEDRKKMFNRYIEFINNSGVKIIDLSKVPESTKLLYKIRDNNDSII